MPYIIALIAIAIAAIAFTVLRTDPVTEPENITTEEVRLPEETDSIPEDEVNTSETEVTPVLEAELEVSQATTTPISTEEPDISLVSEIADTPAVVAANTSFADGSYTTRTSYFTPRRTEHIMDITLTVENDIVTGATIIWDGEAAPKTPSHSGFDAAYKAEVVGQPLEAISLSRVGGASLTSGAFNEAISTIQVEARTS